MAWTVIVNEVYPGYSTYIGAAGYGRHVAQIDKTNIPFVDQWIVNTYKQTVLDSISSEGKQPLWVVIQYQEFATIFYVEARFYLYDPAWAAPTQGTGVQWIPPVWLTPELMLLIATTVGKIITLTITGIIVWMISNVIQESTAVIWGPEGPEGVYSLSWIFPTAVLVAAGALFISAVTGVMGKGTTLRVQGAK